MAVNQHIWPWTSQPQEAVQAAYSAFRAPPSRHLAVIGGQVREVTTADQPIVATGTSAVEPVGLVTQFNGTAGQYIATAMPDTVTDSTEWSFAFHARLTGSLGLTGIFNLGDAGIGYWWSTSGMLVGLKSGDTAYATQLTANPGVDKWHRWVVVKRAGINRAEIWCDGKNISANGTAGLTLDGPRFEIGRGITGLYPSAMQVEQALFFEYPLSADEIRTWADYPWAASFDPQSIRVPVSAGGGGSTVTASTNIGAAIQAARSAAATVNAAIQQQQTASASVNAAIVQAKTIQAALGAAILQARNTTASVNAAIAASQSKTATVDAAISLQRSSTASISANISVASSVSASTDAAILESKSGSASLQAYIQAGNSASASLDVAIKQSRTGNATIDGVIQRALSAAAGLNAAVQAHRSATASLSAQIQAGTSQSASLDAAVLEQKSASAAIGSAISVARSASASLSAMIAVHSSISAAVSAVVQSGRSVGAGLGAYILSDEIDDLYPLAGLSQDFPLAGLSQDFPLAGQSQTYPLGQA